MPDWITTTEAAKISGYTRIHITRLLTAGNVKGQRFGRAWQVDRVSLLAYTRKIGKIGEKRGPKSGA
jgi:hypothetical protein